MNFTDKDVQYWGDVFVWLDAKYKIRSEHAIPFDLFMRDPDANERWIQVYFANPLLFGRRREGAAISLLMFLREGPALVLMSAMLIDALQRESDGIMAERSLLPRQLAAVGRIDVLTGQDLQDGIDRNFERKHVVEHRGSYFFEPFNRPPLQSWNRKRNPHVRKLIKCLPGWCHE